MGYHVDIKIFGPDVERVQPRASMALQPIADPAVVAGAEAGRRGSGLRLAQGSPPSLPSMIDRDLVNEPFLGGANRPIQRALLVYENVKITFFVIDAPQDVMGHRPVSAPPDSIIDSAVGIESPEVLTLDAKLQPLGPQWSRWRFAQWSPPWPPMRG